MTTFFLHFGAISCILPMPDYILLSYNLHSAEVWAYTENFHLHTHFHADFVWKPSILGT